MNPAQQLILDLISFSRNLDKLVEQLNENLFEYIRDSGEIIGLGEDEE